MNPISKVIGSFLIATLASIPVLAHSGSHASAIRHSTHAHVYKPHASTRHHSYGERDSHGRFMRSTQAKDAFKHLHPCPSTGRTTGACPGYVVDHVVALKRGGRDDPSNMQWQSVAAAKAKDKVE